jgi:hypothetical protein
VTLDDNVMFGWAALPSARGEQAPPALVISAASSVSRHPAYVRPAGLSAINAR